MDTGEYWKKLFENWPAELPREGLLITTFGETIPFRDYLLSPGIVLLERDKPDSSGSRKVMLAFAAISALKITAVRDLADFKSMGFQAPF